MTDTPNHSYNKPEKGKTDWHVDLNENFASIDADVEIRDTEANKGNYDPKEGAKYEATDSGAVYYGNGDTWVLADREVGTLQATNINDTWLTPADNTIQAIQDIVDNNSSAYIRLKPGVLYEGDTQLYLDKSPPQEGSKQIYINASGAAVNYTGSKQFAVRLEAGNVMPDEDGINDDANDDNWGETRVIGGSWFGPGKYVNESAVFMQNPQSKTNVMPAETYQATRGILVRWKNGWNEGCHWRVGGEGEGFTGEANLTYENPTHVIHLAGSESEFASGKNWDPTGRPRGSGRLSIAEADYFKAANGDGGATIWQDHVSLHGGEVRCSGFLPQDGVGYKISGSRTITKTCTAYFESEGGNSNSYCVELEGTGKHTPLFINPRFATHGGVLKADSGSGLRSINNGRFQTYGRRSEWKFKAGEDINDGNTWLRYEDPNKNFRFTQEDKNLAFGSDDYITAVDNDGNFAPIRGNEHRSKGPSGTTAYKGAFDEHPSADNGDRWYITGDGTPSEGFYGKTSSGVVQLN